MIQLSPGQQDVFDRVMAWHKTDEKTFVLAGYAGTGKTTLARVIADAVDPDGTLFAAFTGKAANILREKGCARSGTLHHYLYSLANHDKKIIAELEKEILDARKKNDSIKIESLLKLLDEKRTQFRKPKFGLNEESVLKRAPLVIVDEYSMLPEKLIIDLEKLAPKILYLGDPFQLPPIEGKCPLEPTLFLTEIHRQARESHIICAATTVREGGNLEFCDYPDFRYQPKSRIASQEYKDAEQIIVGRNATRSLWNGRFRSLNGYDPLELPRQGEKMICLKNEPFLDLFNGMIGYAAYDAKHGISADDYYMLDFEEHAALPVFYGDIIGQGDKYDGYSDRHKQLQRFDYAYAITGHKSQGSEFDNCLVYHEPIGRGVEKRRWLYTCLTRGRNKVTLVEP